MFPSRDDDADLEWRNRGDRDISTSFPVPLVEQSLNGRHTSCRVRKRGLAELVEVCSSHAGAVTETGCTILLIGSCRWTWRGIRR